MVSQTLLEELKIIIKDEYDKDLEMKEVAQIAENLVGYFDLLAKINYRRNNQSHAERKAADKGKSGENRQEIAPSLERKNKLS